MAQYQGAHPGVFNYPTDGTLPQQVTCTQALKSDDMDLSHSCSPSPQPGVGGLNAMFLQPPCPQPRAHQQQRLMIPPVNPGMASANMSLAEFEAWATSVDDYGLICGWTPPLAALYVRLLCTREVQQRVDACVNRQIF